MMIYLHWIAFSGAAVILLAFFRIRDPCARVRHHLLMFVSNPRTSCATHNRACHWGFNFFSNFESPLLLIFLSTNVFPFSLLSLFLLHNLSLISTNGLYVQKYTRIIDFIFTAGYISRYFTIPLTSFKKGHPYVVITAGCSSRVLELIGDLRIPLNLAILAFRTLLRNVRTFDS